MKALNLDPVVQNFVEQIEKSGGKPLYDLTPREARQVLLSVQKGIPENDEIQTDEYLVPLENERKMKLYIIKPATAADPLPVIFYIHGGGWVMGGIKTHRYLIEQLVLRTHVAVVFPEYELSPEAQYPHTTEDLFKVLQYVTEYGNNFDLDLTHLAVVGDSVGANMTVVMSLLASQNENKPKISAQILLYPVTNARFEDESYKEFAQGPWLTAKAMQWFWQQYAPDKNDQKATNASILNNDYDTLSALPPTLVVTDENDVLRDEGENFAAKLNKAGVEVAAVRINGTIHDFMMLYDLRDSAATQATFDLVAAYIKRKIL